MAAELTTARLSLRPLAPADLAPLHALWTDEDVRRFLWDGEAIPREQTQSIVARSQALFAESRLGLWGVRERGHEELRAVAGYWHFHTPPVLELVYAVARSHWGQGIATEASRGLLDYAFRELGFEAVDASTDVPNVASIRVMEKLGMRRTRRAVVDGLDTVFYRLERDV